MSEPQKQPEKISFWHTKKAFVLGFSLISIGVIFGYIAYDVSVNQSELEPAQQSPPSVIPEIPNPINPDKFNVANFDRCVKLLIDYVQSFPFPGDKLDTQGQIKQNDILSQYNNLNCPLVEDQLSQTPQYKNRNNLEQ